MKRAMFWTALVAGAALLCAGGAAQGEMLNINWNRDGDNYTGQGLLSDPGNDTWNRVGDGTWSGGSPGAYSFSAGSLVFSDGSPATGLAGPVTVTTTGGSWGWDGFGPDNTLRGGFWWGQNNSNSVLKVTGLVPNENFTVAAMGLRPNATGRVMNLDINGTTQTITGNDTNNDLDPNNWATYLNVNSGPSGEIVMTPTYVSGDNWSQYYFNAVQIQGAFTGGPTLISIATGNWNAGSTWDGGGQTPTPAYATIVLDDTVTVASNGAARSMQVDDPAAVLQINAGRTLAIDTNVKLDQGSMNIDGTLSTGGINAATGTALTIGAGGRLVAHSGALQGVTTGAAGTSTIENSGDVSATQLAMSGTATFVKDGAGKLSFTTGANTIGANNTVQVNAGELEMQSASNPMGSGDLDLNGGTFTVQAPVTTTVVPGLQFGRVSGNVNTTDYPASPTVELGPHVAKTQSGGDWPDNQTNTYWGQMYFDGAKSYNFIESIDDKTWLKIDGTVYINDGSWNNTTKTGLITKATGWYDFELRMSDGGGGQGYVNINPGFQYNDNGIDNTSDADHDYPEDPGDASLFRATTVTVGAIDMTDTDVKVTADSTLNAVTPLDAKFGKLTLQNGALKTKGPGEGMSFTGMDLAPGATAVGVDTEVNTTLGPLQGNNAAATIVKKGEADLVLNQDAAGGLSKATFQVEEGRLKVEYASNPLGAAGVTLNAGGTLTLQGATTVAPIGAVAKSYWNFDSKSGTTITDQAGGGHDGTLIAGADITAGNQGYGGAGEALNLTADNQYMDVTNPTTLDFNSSFTWHARIKTTDNSGAIFSRNPDGTAWNQGSKAFFVRNRGGNGEVEWDSGWVSNPRTGTFVHDGAWHDVVATFDASTDKLIMYVDGVEKYNGTHNVNNWDEHTHSHNGGIAHTSFTVGKADFSGGLSSLDTLIGLIDDAAVFDRVLSPSEVASLTSTGGLAARGAINIQNTITVDVPGPALATGLKGEYYTRNGDNPGTYQGERIDLTSGEFYFPNDPGGGNTSFADGPWGRLEDNFFVRWTGFLDVPQDGTYNFRMNTDDRSRMFIDVDGDSVLEAAPGQPAWTVNWSGVSLTAGNHAVEFNAIEYGGGDWTRVEWELPGTFGWQTIPASFFSTMQTPSATLELITDMDTILGDLDLLSGQLLITGGNDLTVEELEVFGDSTIVLDINGGATFDDLLIYYDSVLTLRGANWLELGNIWGTPGTPGGPYTAEFFQDHVTLTGIGLEPRPDGDIPEPATMAMLVMAVAGVGGYVRRRRRA